MFLNDVNNLDTHGKRFIYILESLKRNIWVVVWWGGGGGGNIYRNFDTIYGREFLYHV